MIYDCFTFFNELDLLDIRLNVLNDVVDRFVLVEATHTHQFKPKPLYYSDNKERFKAFEHKIIHIIVDDLPKAKNSWDMERFQRNAIARGIKDCMPGDTIIVSDLDEIPDPKKIKQFENEPGLKVFQQKNFYYYLNCLALDEEWYGSVMAFRNDFDEPQKLREVAKEMHARNKKVLTKPLYRFFRSLGNPVLRKKITLVDNGGWQFGYLGNVDNAIQKIEAFAHDEYNKTEFKDKEAIAQRIRSGKDLFGRDLNYTFVEFDNSFPEYILQNKERLKHLIR
jgi:hypothetical protein